MTMYALKSLVQQPFRFLVTVFGIALCVVMILFLLGIYKGVSTGSVEYVRASDADLWVLQRHATNILRSTSLLGPDHGTSLKRIKGIEAVSPVFFILASVRLAEDPATLYLTGFDPGSGRGGPPGIVRGRTIRSSGEIVLDRSFAAKHHIQVGDTLPVKNRSLVVVGLSRGTNMFVIQYAFITLADAHRIIGHAGIVTCYLLKVAPGADLHRISTDVETGLPDVVVYGREEFLANNTREMESGILPLLFVVAVIGSVVLMTILSLILSINVLERRTDYAVMKAIGAPAGFIPRLVILQAGLLAGCGLIIGIALFFPLMTGIEQLSPEVSVVTSPFQIVSVIVSVLVISMISSVFPNQKLRNVYPLEVFK